MLPMTPRPTFQQLNLVVTDMGAAVDFYRLLGLNIDAGPEDWPPGTGGCHSSARSTDGSHLDLDNAAFAHTWGHDDLAAGRPVIGFSFPTRDAVDDTYRALVTAGYEGRLGPYDAFFGSRYAIVADPDGHDIGLMSPRQADRGFIPDRDGQPSAT